MEVGLEPTQSLPGQYPQADRDQGPGLGVQQAMGSCHSDQLVAEISSRVADSHDLSVLREFVLDFPVTRLNFISERRLVNDVVACESVHPRCKLLQVGRSDEI